jgi:hypothetical protein
MATTKQSIFNRVAKHLLAQNKQAKNNIDHGLCAYRTEDGLACAVGCLIPKRDYSPQMECGGVNSLIWEQQKRGYKIPKYFSKYKSFLIDLQLIHDGEEPKNWRQCLEDFAITNNLTMPS